ncbi:MAG: cysteine desulfurase [Cryomorphaceae bacterium MED-G14]|nr:MAG: cysteine desulfurase [Cryomorphaceae bacterium MED-G14]|tara:strand:- start:525 stop:1664 length:1140 start_codon:yes stop_codon:yes gene_type:complete
MSKIYFDNAATTPISNDVVEIMHQVMKNNFGNPSSTHSFGRESRSIIELTRKNISEELNVKPSEIIFTSGGTESNNMIIKGAVETHKIERIITTKIEHKAVLETVESCKIKHHIELIYLPIDSKGLPSLFELEKILDSSNKRTLVSLMHINNEIGSIIDLNKFGKLCKKYNSLFHSDTVQTIGHYKLDLSKLNIDFLTCSAHKFHGPKGIGFTFLRNNSKLNSFIEGGSQERGLRGGTESIHNIAGLNLAFLNAYKNLEKDSMKIKSIKKYFIEKLTEEFDIKINGCRDESSYTILNVLFPISISKKPILNFKLDLQGIACSGGSACQSGSDKPSHVLSEILGPDLIKNISIRFSFSKLNSIDEVDKVVNFFKEFINEN